MVPISKLTTRRLRDRPAEPDVIGLDGETADRVFDALASETTREILSLIYEEPQSPSKLATATGTTLQNVTYHLNKLRDAELIEPAQTHYSEKGQSVVSYGPTREAVVVVAGPPSIRRRLRSALSQVLVVALLLGAASAAVAMVADRLMGSPIVNDQVGDGGGAMEVRAVEHAPEAAGGLGVDPAFVAGIAFFVGGVFVLTLIGAWWVHRSRYR